jgi:Cytosol aminopeptidase family, N-terminal domain
MESMMKFNLRQTVTVLLKALLVALYFGTLSFAHSQTPAKPAEFAVPGATIPTRVLVQGPTDTNTDLQIFCLFHSDPSNTLHGSLIEADKKTHGLLTEIRKPGLFAGDLGETIVFAPAPGTLAAKKVLIIGLGDSQTFTLDRMDLVGAIAYREAVRLGVANPFFAPTLLDGGLTGIATGDTAQHVVDGFLRAAATERILRQHNMSGGVAIQSITFLAGPKFAGNTRDGLARAYAKAASH